MQHKTNKLIQIIPTKRPNIFTVQLNLLHQTRYIGKLDTTGDGTFSTKRKEEHIFKKLNALGLSHSLLTDDSIKFNRIVFSLNGKKLHSSRAYFLKKGTAFQFSKRSFELQLFVSLDKLNLNEVKRFEASQVIQEDLFNFDRAA